MTDSRFLLIKLDTLLGTIMDLQQRVESDYAPGKILLSEVRSAVALSDFSEAVKKAKKALELFAKESEVASEYIRVCSGFAYSDSVIHNLKEKYKRKLAQCDYQGARDSIKELEKLRSVEHPSFGDPVFAKLYDGSDGSAVLEIHNGRTHSIHVTGMYVYRGTVALCPKIYTPITVRPGSKLCVDFEPSAGTGPIRGTITIEDMGITSTIDAE